MSKPRTTAEILEERGGEYGLFSEHAKITQGLKVTVRSWDGWARMLPCHREAIEMILHKIGRILNGNPMNRDSWADIAGYAELVVREIDAKQKSE